MHIILYHTTAPVLTTEVLKLKQFAFLRAYFLSLVISINCVVILIFNQTNCARKEKKILLYLIILENRGYFFFLTVLISLKVK